MSLCPLSQFLSCFTWACMLHFSSAIAISITAWHCPFSCKCIMKLQYSPVRVAQLCHGQRPHQATDNQLDAIPPSTWKSQRLHWRSAREEKGLTKSRKVAVTIFLVWQHWQPNTEKSSYCFQFHEHLAHAQTMNNSPGACCVLHGSGDAATCALNA